jgi:hypothetical protein
LIPDEQALLEYISPKYTYTRIIINGETQIAKAERTESIIQELMERSTNE